jgi:hypothetical protein
MHARVLHNYPSEDDAIFSESLEGSHSLQVGMADACPTNPELADRDRNLSDLSASSAKRAEAGRIAAF